MSDLKIRLLGGFSVAAGDPVPGLNAGRLQSLLGYLLLHRGVPQQRQRLAFLFWPDTPEEWLCARPDGRVGLVCG
ncbi:hypothetical protein BH24GEM3_BH24GEM3_15450 [soil metagenome]